MKFRILALMLAFFVAACSTSTSSNEDNSSNATKSAIKSDKPLTKADMEAAIADAEKVLYDKENVANFDRQKAFAAVQSYEQFTKAYKDDPKTPEHLFKAAEIYRSLRNFKKAVETYENIYKNYPSYEKAPHSLFLLGFSYENDLKDNEKAKKLYEEFIAKYPEHELADDVQFSLSNLGRSPEDIIKSFETQNKK